ncbi:unnamed protein product [Rotaria magnacalcarata]|uniref:Uncharacterized protein n=1 Tax=Rotaria magnacalcarata TaxID=392030 RepID=A0A816F9M8_9BILA|nr:unnamed protein product [Rotaria magnacalcarata]CAF1658048.1 unnamed protein product [Rotaria magnacalcarata]CAF2154671.1 unnamed protein product [Rotaria magnacalcarata]CAF3792718.1 unnamed protein product [Rotaria magnacalcarata]CAF3938476.1 unnamed protein product [Rotaria magnacalcarata]
MTWKYMMLVTLIFTSIIYVHSDPLYDLNEQFLRAYDRVRDHLMSTISPIIICTRDNVTVLHRGQRYEEQVIPKLYHDLKSISHIPLTIYLTLLFNFGNLSDSKYIELKKYLQDIRSLRNSIRFPAYIQQNQDDIVDLSIEYLRTVLKRKFVEKRQLKTYCQQTQTLFSINIELAARLHLDMLDSKIRPWYQHHFNDTERNSLRILIMGPKTARHGFLTKEYFYTLIGERHEGKHIIYVESVDNEQQALEILGAWLLDAQTSTTFYDGDSERLHRDLLADAAKTHIKRLFEKSKLSMPV